MTQRPDFPPLARVPTGIAGLDAVLHGGFLRGGLYIILGAPGAGKTILANQMAFHHVATGGKVTYVTLLAETHARMLAHLQMMEFFDPGPVAVDLSYLSGYRTLKEEGLRGLLQFLRAVTREQRTTMLVIDGLVTAEGFSSSEVDYKQFIHELHTFLEAINCTGLLLSQEAQGEGTAAAHTMVDGLIELRDTPVGLRSVRELRVRKFRGSAHLRGQHMFEISDDGITVHPRTEAVRTREPVPLLSQPRVAFGIPGLDSMLRDGVPTRSTTLALGLPGSGKTSLATHFLSQGVAAGEAGLLFTFSETPEDLANLAEGFGLPLASESASVEVMWQLPGEHNIDVLAERMIDGVARLGARRLVIDSLSGFQAATISPERLGTFLAAVLNELRARDVTTLLIMETPRIIDPTEDTSRLGISALVDNILFLRYIEDAALLRREVAVIKMRRSGFDPLARTFTISDRGFAVATPAQGGAEGGAGAPQRTEQGRSRRRRDQEL